MGVPKFFRWLSERYPAISQLIADNRIPEFDCLYLDMNGIIHNCTHKDGDASFRLSEDEMFIRIFNYIEHLFGKIKPKQLFFMAVDGVAPRAKMNQQRARRFRTALDAEKAREKAIKNGESLPKDDPFDSNCITPGTEFMAKLSQQLQYFVHKKVSEDSDWQQCEIVLSGHEVPGEGEHKIMEYIRNAKAQPNYDANVRHCLYGLDADLIMLGLLSHDPHFCLLREEVTFGRPAKSQSKELEHQNFYLLHLCMVREYLELEFQDLKAPGAMKFPFDMERVIDDFILMAFFVGNDFLPNLPGLHINEGALADMFSIYKEVLPASDGYINENGVINLERLGMLLSKLEKVDYKNFEREMDNAKWMQSKKQADETAVVQSKGKKLVVTSSQRKLWDQKISKYLRNRKRSREPLNLGSGLNAADRKFVQDLAERFRMPWCTQVDDDGQRHLVISFPEKAGGDDDDDDDEEMHLAMNREMKRYQNAEVVDKSPEEAQAQYKAVYDHKFQEWKNSYYTEKLSWTPENMDAELTAMCENYVQGLQWVLYYYYRGIVSWPWFYRYHYSPWISDVMKGLNANLKFKLGQPFQPFEQLMGVLPDRSKKIVPQVYWDLMTDTSSPIKDFYPRDFELDMNGKKMDWEAVVLIPFIDEKRLLDAMAPKNELLSDEERQRNSIGYAIKFAYDQTANDTYPSSLPGIFPDIPNCRCAMNVFELPPTEGLEYRVGLVDGAKLNVEALAGFPSLATLAYTATLGFHGVNVFQQDSRNESMVVKLSGTETRAKVEAAKAKLDQRCHVGYPFLQEAKIVRVSDELFDYVLENGHVVQKHHSPREIDDFKRKAQQKEHHYSKRFGIIIDTIESFVHVEHLKGLVKTDDGATVKEYGIIPGQETDWPAQLIVDEVVSQDERFIERDALPIEVEFPVGAPAFFLGSVGYGCPVGILGHDGNKLHIAVGVPKVNEPNFVRPVIAKAEHENRYTPSHGLAYDLTLHPMILSRITASFFVWTLGGSLKVNLGLNLKFEAKKQKVLGYTRKSHSGWEFSAAAIQLLTDYMVTFPDFFAALKRLKGVQTSGGSSDLEDTELFPEVKEAEAAARVKEIGAWLKSKETSKLERVPLDAEQLDSGIVMAIAAGADDHQISKLPREKKVFKNVPRSAVIRPADAVHRLGNQRFSLGDRITYVQDSGKVPIGFRGTVVGISRTATTKLLDIVFDEPFMSGTTLGERCPAFRGQTVPAMSVLNMTDKQIAAGTHASRHHSQAMRPTPLQARRGGANGQHQYHDTPAPAPLLSGWSQAATGTRPNRGPNRGRGGTYGAPANIQSSQLVYRPLSHYEPQQYAPQGSRGGRGGPRGRGGPAQQMESYNAVPPPPNLDNQRGARARGRGRGGRGNGSSNSRGSRGSGQGGRGTRGRASSAAAVALS